MRVCVKVGTFLKENLFKIVKSNELIRIILCNIMLNSKLFDEWSVCEEKGEEFGLDKIHKVCKIFKQKMKINLICSNSYFNIQWKLWTKKYSKNFYKIYKSL